MLERFEKVRSGRKDVGGGLYGGSWDSRLWIVRATALY